MALRKFAIVAASAAVLGSALSASAAQVLLNTSFENGTGGDADNWNEIQASGDPTNATPTAARVQSNPHTGLYSMQLSYTNTSTPGTGSNAEVQQLTSPPGVVNPGEMYNLSFFAKQVGALGDGTVGFYRVAFLDSDGSDGGGEKGSTGLQQYQGQLVDGQYQQITLNNILVPATADAALVSIQLAGGAVPNASGLVYIDDVTLTNNIPEPTSLALLGLGGLGLMRRRRA